jgi:hypothetical protein
MDTPTFWKLIETAKSRSKGDPFKQTELVRVALQKLPPEEIVAFDKIFGQLKAESYRKELWAAAYIIQGGCSDDGFEYFRCWLIAQGQKVYEEALRDPETLADVFDYDEEQREEVVDVVGNEMVGMAWRAYEAKTGKEMPARPVREVLKGRKWDEENVGSLYPKLQARFG